ncbi:MAG TPA: LysR family transcriptional regulator [Paraburkholderia sp.]|nr:LysR family transcriptional regulator [Paraburkholderia sp.]
MLKLSGFHLNRIRLRVLCDRRVMALQRMLRIRSIDDKSLLRAVLLPDGNVWRFPMQTSIERFFSSGLRLTHLRLLVALADLKQVTKVARAFNVTQAAVSKQISELEQSIGTTLTERVGRNVVLTDVGEIFVARGREVLRQLGYAQRDVSSLMAGTAGRVTLGAVTTLSHSFISMAVDNFIARAPQASISFSEGLLEPLLESLRNEETDLVIARTGSRETADIVQEHLYHEPCVFVTGPQQSLRIQGRPLTARDLSGLKWIVPMRESPSHAALGAFMANAGFDIDAAAMESSSMPLNVELLSTGDYVAILPMSYAYEHAARGRISILSIPPLDTMREVVLYQRRGSKNSAAHVLADCIRMEAAKLTARIPSHTADEDA